MSLGTDMSKLHEETTVGKEWTRVKLDSLCNILIGGTPARNHAEYWDIEKSTKNVWLSIADLSRMKGKYVSDSAEYISDEGIKRSNVKEIKSDTVLMSFKLSIGKVAITRSSLYTNEAIAAFEIKQPDKIISGFLYYALPTLAYDTDQAVKGKTLNKEKLKDVELVFPPIVEQKKIVHALSSVDEEILKSDETISMAEKLKNGLMQDLFSKGIKHTKFKKTKIGSIPATWEVVTGGDITELITKGASPKWQGFAYQKEGTLFVTSENVRDGVLDIDDPKFLPIKFHQKLKNSQLKANDILINIVGASIGRSCLYKSAYPDANINQAVCLVRTNDRVLPSFLVQFLQYPQTIQRLLDSQNGSARQNLSLSDIRRFLFVQPPLLEQERIIEILSAFDQKISIQKSLKEKLIQLKKGLISDLLTGRTRV